MAELHNPIRRLVYLFLIKRRLSWTVTVTQGTSDERRHCRALKFNHLSLMAILRCDDFLFAN